MKILKFLDTPSVKIFVLFAAVLFLAFLPISTFLFFIKNDTFCNYFPPKFFISESIHAGYLPLWNPYINFGIPQYGDMNSGYWSPITWAIASTVGYSAYTVTIETLTYILLGGLGFVKLSGIWISSKNVRVIAGLAFMCCGYHVAHLQHFNWLSGSAFLPWCMWSYISFLNNKSITNTLSTTLLVYLFIASAHPGLIIGAFYFFIALMVFFYFQNSRQLSHASRIKQFGVAHIIFISALLLLSLGIIAGYSDIIPHFVRGEKVSLESSAVHSSNLKTHISLLLPFSTVKNDAFFNTDLTLRNSYFSLPLLVLLLVAVIGKKNSWQKFLLGLGLIFGSLAAGGYITEFAHHYVPLIGYVRLVGEFRIFAIISFILIGAIELDKFSKQQKKNTVKLIKLVVGGVTVILCTMFIWAMYSTFLQGKGFRFNLSKFQSISGFAEKAKHIVDSISFYDTILIQSSIQLVLLFLVYKSLRLKNINYVKWLVVVDVMLSALLNMPFTGAGKTSVSHLQSVLNKSPKGIPIPELHPIKSNDSIAKSDNDLLGSWSMYSKQPGTQKEMPYPIQLNNMRVFFDNSDKTTTNYFEKPFIYTDDGNEVVTILSYSPTKIMINAFVDSASKIIILQNNYKHWKYQNEGETYKVLNEGINFMAIPLKKGENNVTLIFDPKHIRVAMFVSAIVFIIYLVLFLYYRTKGCEKI